MQRYETSLARASELDVNVDRGLSSDEVIQRRHTYGENRMPEAKSPSIWSIFLGSLNDKTLFVLLGAAFLALGVEALQQYFNPQYEPHYLDGIAILGAVLVASAVTTLNEARAAKEFRLLNQEGSEILIKVRRDEHVHQLSIFELVVGDLVVLDTGDALPADGLLLEGSDLRVDQSTLTGESDHVTKGENDLQLKGGTVVTAGNGLMLVTAVGLDSEVGKLHHVLTQQEEGDTPLQERLGKLADQIGLFGLAAAVLTFSALVISGLVRDEFTLSLNLATAQQILSFLIVAVTIVVVAVPEGLPLAVTISLAYSVRKMAAGKNLVRHLSSCETMGAATVICSDKTGTLTRNRMTVGDARMGAAPGGAPPTQAELGHLAEKVARIAAINATAHLDSSDGVEKYVGNPTECALLSWVAGWGVDWEGLRRQADVEQRLGFSSERKRMSTVINHDGSRVLLTKGAPEVILSLSHEVLTDDGVIPLDDSARDSWLATIDEFSSRGFRTLALAERSLSPQNESQDADLEQQLTLIGVVAIADPVRDEVPGAVAQCRRAGVALKIVTGDNEKTARSIGNQIGLLDGDDLVMTGEEFRDTSDEEIIALLPRLKILARSVPSDKHRLVMLLKQTGEVVAVTGDGTNDAPALHAADVGFSMGISGTEVAKEASDIVILDDNFASIVTGIRWGRSIFENIRKFLQFQLTVNVVALSTAFLAAVLGFGIPLNTVQLLWVNLIMDTMAALALATEPPAKELLDQPPHGRHAPLITRSMWISILAMGTVMVTVLVVIMLGKDFLLPGATQATLLTFVFNVFVMMQVFNELNARSTRFDRGVFRSLADSKLFIGVIGVTLLSQVAIVQFGGSLFKTVPLSLNLWLASVVVGASTLLVGFALRQIGRRLPRQWLGLDDRELGTT